MRNKVLLIAGSLLIAFGLLQIISYFLKYQFFGDCLRALFDTCGFDFINTPEFRISGTRSKIPPYI